MKVLMVSDICTHPHNRGNLQGVYRECCQIKKLGWEIDFLYWGSRIHSDIDAMKDFFGEEHFYFANLSNVSLVHQIRAYIRNKMDRYGITKHFSFPYDIDEYYYQEIEDKVHLLLKKEEYDIVWLEYYLQSKMLCSIDKSILKVIHTHDRMGGRNKIFQKIGQVPEFYYLTLKGEKEALSRADIVIAVQDEEQEYFSTLLEDTGTKCVTIGNLVEMKDSQDINKKNYGFIGTNIKPNRLALEWFISNVLPHVLEKEPESVFIIAGGICEAIPDSANYIKLGFVNTLEEFYNNVKFVIGPIRNGTGLNIKNIEALSYKKPLITTKIGAKGLEGAEKSMIVCDDEIKFGESILALFNNKELFKTMRDNTEYFIEKYNQKNINTMIKIGESALQRKREKM